MPRKSTVSKKRVGGKATDAITPRRRVAAHLGEELVNSDSSTEEEEQAESFHSAEPDEDATDYGLEFTTSRFVASPNGRTGSRSTAPQSTRAQRSEEGSPSKSTSRRSNESTLRTSSKVNPKAQPGPSERQQSPSKQMTHTSQQSRSEEAQTDDTDVESSISEESRQVIVNPPKKNTKKSEPLASKRKQMKPFKKPPEAPVLKDIRKLQHNTKLLIPRLPFSRVIRECFTIVSDVDLRVTVLALEALQEAAEMYLTQLFQDAWACTLHRERKTLSRKDLQLVRYLRGRSDPGNR